MHLVICVYALYGRPKLNTVAEDRGEMLWLTNMTVSVVVIEYNTIQYNTSYNKVIDS